MIVSIEGQLVEATPLRLVIETGGLGYEVQVPVTTAERLPGPGQRVKLHTHTVYREDSQALYGFATVADRDFFRLLIEHVSGVGPKVALGIMSRLSLPLLESAIRNGEVGTLAKCPGIGKKTAERLVVELRNRVGAAPGSNAAGPSTGGLNSGTAALPGAGTGNVSDAVLALTALGYKTADADKSIRQAVLALGADATTEQLVKRALGR